MNDDVAKKHAALVERLYKRTNDKSLKWVLDDSRQPKAELGDYTLTLYDGNSRGNPVEYLTIATQYNEVIETVDDEDLSELTPKISKHDSYYPLMEELRALAFRQAVGADRALDDLLEELDDDDL
ncbi:hypothetical protein [Sphingomonas sp.]|uniref:hypothetical protein n=1 Tax=Sphingomonas sp. TaxID=28214 RepID=UPI0035BC38AE